jgi:hypothetical protein
MQECGCYDPGFILRLLLNEQNGRALSVWLQEQMQALPALAPLPNFSSLSQNDIVWLSETELPETMADLVTISHFKRANRHQMADLSLDVKGPQGLKTLLTQFMDYLRAGVYLTRLTFNTPKTDTEAAKIHLLIRLLRAILTKLNAGMLLLPDNSACGIERESFLGNTLNEAHLVYNDALPAALKASLNEGTARSLNQLAEGLKLPGLNVAYFNYLPANLIADADLSRQALTILMALSGLAAIDSFQSGQNEDTIIQLIKARGKAGVFHPASAQMIINLDETVFSLMKISPNATELVLCLHNLQKQDRDIDIDTEALGIPEGEWLDLLSGGKQILNKGQKVHLNGLSSLWLDIAY